MNRRFTFFPFFPFVLALVAFVCVPDSLWAQHDAMQSSATQQVVYASQQSMPRVAADDDSLKSRAEIEAEIQVLQQQIADLNAQIESMDDGAEKDRLVLQVSELDSRVIALEQQLEGRSAKDDEWDFEGFGDDDPEWENGESSTDFDEWSDFESGFFQKYPAVFSWGFPMETEFGNTFIRYNRVEGFYLGIAKDKRLNWHSKKQIVSTFSLGYGFASMKGRYSAGLYFPFYLGNQIVEIGGEGHHFTDSKDQWTMDVAENSVMAFFAKEDFMDYFQRSGFSASASWYYRTSSEETIRFSGQYIHDTYRGMNKETNWSLFGGDKSFRENPIENALSSPFPIHGNVNSLMFGVGYSTTPMDSREHGSSVSLTYEAAGAFMAGDYEFNQLIFDARRYQPLGEHVNLNARFRLGGSDGNLPFQRSFDIGGIGTLPGYRFKMLSGTHLGLLNTEIIIKSSIAGVADGWFQRLMESFNLILFYDVGSVVMTYPEGDYVDEANNPVELPISDSVFDGFDHLSSAQWMSSAGVALGSRDGSYRIGVAWPLTGETKDATFVIRLAAPF